MRSIRSTRLATLTLALGAMGLCFVPAVGARRDGRPRSSSTSRQQAKGLDRAGNANKGREEFLTNCALCHGVDATGGEGPNIQRAPAALGEEAVRNIIMRGVPGTEMPSFFMMLNASEVSEIMSYLRQLARTATAGTVTGDPAQGEALFKTSGCSSCHMIDGLGGDLGPDLSRVSSIRGPSYLHKKLLDPAADLPTTGAEGDRGKWTRYLLFRAVKNSGKVVEGMRVGEDSFTIVLRDAQGTFHSLYKPDLRSLEKEPGKSLMPSSNGRLSPAQLDDLVAYLSTLKGAQ
ncbi:MAG: c-type cytochrome [Candidatus Acidiferrales bacterium]